MIPIGFQFKLTPPMIDPARLSETERFLHDQIPLSKAMGVRIASMDRDGLVLTAPLEENHNHLGTAFGGSLGAIAVLAGYALLWLETGADEGHIVVRASTIDYRRPVHGPLRAVCHAPAAEEMERLRDTCLKKGKARISLNVSVVEDGEVCVAFEGEFVVIC